MVRETAVGVIEKAAKDWGIQLPPEDLKTRCTYTCHEIELAEKQEKQRQE